MSIAAKNISFNLAGLTVYRQHLFYIYYSLPPRFRQIVPLSLHNVGISLASNLSHFNEMFFGLYSRSSGNGIIVLFDFI